MSTTLIQPYLTFGGRCEEALDYYKSTLGAEVEMVMQFKQSPTPCDQLMPDGWGDKVMHCSFLIGDARVMASDGCGDPLNFEGISLSLTLPDADAAKKAFDALATEGQITMPMSETFWSPCFGMVADKFGVHWMITVPEEKSF